MGLEFVYQNNYEYTTVDTLALRENVKKILQNANTKVIASTNTEQTLNNTENNEIVQETELTSTMNFLKSESALKLLNLTKKSIEEQNEYAEIIELNIDESKRNIFAA